MFLLVGFARLGWTHVHPRMPGRYRTAARGHVGPNLTHVGSRLSLGAGTVPNEPAGFIRWIERTNHIKPGVHMPHFGMLPREELNALAAYLEALQ